MHKQPAPRVAQKDRAAAQGAYLNALDALRSEGALLSDDERFLGSLRPVAIDEADRIVLEFASQHALASASRRPALTKLARALRTSALAAGLAPRVTPPKPKNTSPQRLRSGPPLQNQKLLYIPAFFATMTLPHRRVAGSEYLRVNGDQRLSMLAPEESGLPYGVYPRLALIHLTTRALLQKRRTICVGESANEFLAFMGIGDSGGPRGESTRAREQLRRLCRTTFTYSVQHGKRDSGHNILCVEEWVAEAGRGLEVRLGEQFFDLARSRSLPLDGAIVHGLRRSPLALDTYMWLTYRVATVQEETLIPWRPLERQFGASYKHARDFRAKFRRSVAAVQKLWPGVEAEPRERGLLLRPCAPSVLSWLERVNANVRPFPAKAPTQSLR